MSMELLRQAFSTKMVADWAGTDIERVQFGDNDSPFSTEDGSWVRLTFSVFDNENAELGKTFQRANGIIDVQCFTEKNSGEKEAMILADAVAAVFQNKNFDGVSCYVVSVTKPGVDGDSYQINARARFKYDVFS